MFGFVIRYLSFLKHVPLLPYMFDNLLKIRALLTNPQLLDWIDEIEAEVLKWDKASITMHKYGGIQFNIMHKEIGHIHSNGLVDILLSTAIKDQLLRERCITSHHTFKNSGWISFYIRTKEDKAYAIRLLKLATTRGLNKHLLMPLSCS
jgi:hypothetical protein